MDDDDDKITQTLNLIFQWKLKDDLDDTLLQKLLSALVKKESLINCINIEKFQGVFSNEDHNPQAVAFSLQLLKVILPIHQTNENTSLLGDLNLLNLTITVIRNIANSSPLVKEAALDLLIYLCKYTDLFKWIVENDLFKPGWQCLSGKSIFVQRGAEAFLATVLITSKRDTDSIYNSVGDQLLLQLEVLIQSDKPLGALNVLLKATEEFPDCISKQKDQRLVKILILKLKAQQFNEKICRILALVISTNLVDEVQSCLLEQNQFIELITFSYHLNHRVDDCFHKNPLLHLPIEIILHDQLDKQAKIWDSTNKAFYQLMTSDNSMRTKIIVRCLGYYSKLVEIADEELKMKILQNSSGILSIVAQLGNSGKYTPLQLQVSKCKKSLIGVLDVVNQLILNLKSVPQDIFDSLLKLIGQIDLSPSAFHSCSTIIGNFMKSSDHQLEWKGPRLICLGEILAKRCFDIHWETRDSSLELIHKLLESGNGNSNLSKWIISHKFHSLVWDLMSSSNVESYVRATCISIFAILCNSYSICRETLQVDNGVDSKKVTNILPELLKDEEAFVQRAAITAFPALLHCGLLDFNEIQVTKCLCWSSICAIDWQVKLEALKTWQQIEDNLFKKYLGHEIQGLVKLVERLREIGYLKSLAATLVDCDRPVRLLSANIVKDLRLKLTNENFSLPPFCEKLIETEIPKEIPNPPIFDAVSKSSAIESVIDMEMHDRIVSIISDRTSMLKLNFAVSLSNIDENIVWIADLEAIIKDAEKSTDVYDDNLDALLDDLIAASFFKEENQVLDCY